jgi:hypothetical protein
VPVGPLQEIIARQPQREEASPPPPPRCVNNSGSIDARVRIKMRFGV